MKNRRENIVVRFGMLLQRSLMGMFLACALLAVLTPAQSQPGLSAAVKAQIASLQQEKAARTPAQKKLDSHLVYAVKTNRKEVVAKASRA